MLFLPRSSRSWLKCYFTVLISFIRNVTLSIPVNIAHIPSACKERTIGRDLLIHITDLKPDNIMVRLEDKTILDRDARDEYENPLPQKRYDDRAIYLSRNNYGQPTSATGIVSITDFGHSVHGDISNNGCIQAEVYRAPEVILEAGWTYSADIWSLGVMVVSLLFWHWRDITSDLCHSYGIYWRTRLFSKWSIL